MALGGPKGPIERGAGRRTTHLSEIRIDTRSKQPVTHPASERQSKITPPDRRTLASILTQDTILPSKSPTTQETASKLIQTAPPAVAAPPPAVTRYASTGKMTGEEGFGRTTIQDHIRSAILGENHSLSRSGREITIMVIDSAIEAGIITAENYQLFTKTALALIQKDSTYNPGNMDHLTLIEKTAPDLAIAEIFDAYSSFLIDRTYLEMQPKTPELQTALSELEKSFMSSNRRRVLEQQSSLNYYEHPWLLDPLLTDAMVLFSQLMHYPETKKIIGNTQSDAIAFAKQLVSYLFHTAKEQKHIRNFHNIVLRVLHPKSDLTYPVYFTRIIMDFEPFSHP